MYADGRFEASDTDSARRLVFEDSGFKGGDPEKRRVWTLGEEALKLALSPPSTQRIGAGAVLVRSTLFSPNGPPSVRLDGKWPIHSVVPVSDVPAAYEVDLILQDPASTPHWLDATAPIGKPRDSTGNERESARADFQPEQDICQGPSTRRALLVGNANYREQQEGDLKLSKLPGVLKDVKSLKSALESAESWNLGKKFLDVQPNLTADRMRQIEAFFREAKPGETLLFYFAGHGREIGGMGYLLPIDYQLGTTPGSLSARQLWEAIKASPAERVIVILDACRAGDFLLPRTMGLEANERRNVAFLVATAAGGTTLDTTQGSPFTQGLVEALGLPEKRHPLRGAVTVDRAFFHAANRVAELVPDQIPQIFGAVAALHTPLSCPTGAKMPSSPIRTAGRSVAIEIESSKIEPPPGQRQIDVPAKDVHVMGDGSDRKLELTVRFGNETPMLRVSFYYPKHEYRFSMLDHFEYAPGGIYRTDQRTTIAVPLVALTTRGTYRVQVQPCDTEGDCGVGRKLVVEL